MDTILSTKRLNLNLVGHGDLEDIHELHSLPETDRFNTLGIPENIQQTRRILQEWIDSGMKDYQTEYTFAIREKSTGTFIGLIALKCGSPKFRKGEVWYKLHGQQWRKGYGTEALVKVLEFGFKELDLHRIEAGCGVTNHASIKLLEKVGMIKEGRKRKVLPLKDGWSDNFEYAILEEDWDHS